jgi:L-alanine-DL-glutamate epimerase-like enolase superfamily enzyme
MKSLAEDLAWAWAEYDESGHALEVGWSFVENCLGEILRQHNRQYSNREAMPWLAALIVCSAFDIALHDAYGRLHDLPVYQTYTSEFLSGDLSSVLEPAHEEVSFAGFFPCDFLAKKPSRRLAAWHLVGGLDLLTDQERSGDEPEDGYPVTLTEWIRRDGLECLKIKLRGNDYEWDLDRLVQVGKVSEGSGVTWLTADFNCTVTDPEYVIQMLDRLMYEHPRIWQMILYVEQPFPYELEKYQIDVRELAARKYLFMDESAHDWKLVRLGRKLGWTGVALKTCKTQSGAVLSGCWAKAHGMAVMVQDLTNPMLAQIPHCLLASHIESLMGVETNAIQFYPEASRPESDVHPGLYARKNGQVDLSTVEGPGFGYRLSEIDRRLPEPGLTAGSI